MWSFYVKKLLYANIGDFAPSTRTVQQDGFLFCKDARLAKAPQVRSYYVSELGSIDGYAPEQSINVFTDADTLFNAMASFEHCDLTDYHPPNNVVNSATWRDYCIGMVSNIRRDGDYLIGDVLIKDNHAIQAVMSNHRLELSLGYRADLVLETGDYNGTPYQAKFTNLVGNHVALVAFGRCGSECRIGDSGRQENMMKIIVDGLSFDVADNEALKGAIEKQNAKIAEFEQLKSTTLKVGDNAFKVADEHTALQAVIDTLVADGQAKDEQIKQLSENQATPEKVQAMAIELSNTVNDAKKIHADVKTEGCTCEQIKRNAVEVKAGDSLVVAILGDVAIGDAKPEVIDTAFRALVATAGTTQQQQNPLNPTTQVGDTVPVTTHFDKSTMWKNK